METMKNTTNKIKKKKSSVSRMNTCAKFGIDDCSCCKQINTNMSNESCNNETIVHCESDQTDTKPLNTDPQQLYLPSTSTANNVDVLSYIDIITADINLEEEQQKIKEYEDRFVELIKSEPLQADKVLTPTPEDEEIDVVNGSLENLSFLTNDERITETSTLSTTFDTRAVHIEANIIVNETINSISANIEEEIDVVNETPNTDTFLQAPLTNIPEDMLATQQEQDIEEEIDVGSEIDENAPLSTFLRNPVTPKPPKRRRRKLHRNPVIEDEIIDVVNLTEDSSNLASLSTSLVRANRFPKRKGRLVTVNDDSIIEISDSPVAPKVISEVIHIDDDELSQNSLDSSQKGPNLGSCPVCMEDFTKCEIMSTMCGHVFCAMCIKTVIKTNKKCPKCRKNLTLKSIHPLFI